MAKVGLVGAGCIGGATLLINPRLLRYPTQIAKASVRLLRCGYYGSLIACSYFVHFTSRQ